MAAMRGPHEGLSVQAIRDYVLSENIMANADRLARSALIGDINIQGHELSAKVTGTAAGATKRPPVYATRVTVGTRWEHKTKFVLRGHCSCDSKVPCKHQAGILLKALGCPLVQVGIAVSPAITARAPTAGATNAVSDFKNDPAFWKTCAQNAGTAQVPVVMEQVMLVQC